MARITVEDCLKEINNRFALIHMAAKRVRQLRKGAEPTVVSKNRDIVVSLREIAAGHVVKAEGPVLPAPDEDSSNALTEGTTEKPDESAPEKG